MPNQNRIKSSLTSRKKGIYIEYIEVMNGTYHSYLTFEDGEGNTRVIRGGPTNASLSNAIFGGDIEMQSDIPLSKSRDAYGIEDTPQTRHSTKLDLEGRSPEKVWKTMKETASLITKGKIDYDLHETLPKTGKMQNSNTVVSNVLRGAGLDPTKVKTPNPETYMAKVYGPTPGFNKNLMKESAYDGWDIITGSSNEAFQTKLYHLQNKSKNDIFNADQEMKAIDKRNSATKLEPKQQSGLDTEAQEKIKTAFTTADDELSETVLKKGSQLTSDEVKKLMTQRARLPDGPEKSRLEQTVQSHFGDVYGNDRVETSITGRMLEPEAKIAIPEKETPATTLGGTKIVDGKSVV